MPASRDFAPRRTFVTAADVFRALVEQMAEQDDARIREPCARPYVRAKPRRRERQDGRPLMYLLVTSETFGGGGAMRLFADQDAALSRFEARMRLFADQDAALSRFEDAPTTAQLLCFDAPGEECLANSREERKHEHEHRLGFPVYAAVSRAAYGGGRAAVRLFTEEALASSYSVDAEKQSRTPYNVYCFEREGIPVRLVPTTAPTPDTDERVQGVAPPLSCEPDDDAEYESVW